MNQLNIRFLATTFLAGSTFCLAIVDPGCRQLYIEMAIPALVACVNSDNIANYFRLVGKDDLKH